MCDISLYTAEKRDAKTYNDAWIVLDCVHESSDAEFADDTAHMHPVFRVESAGQETEFVQSNIRRELKINE